MLDNKQTEYTIEPAENNLDPFEDVAVEFESSITKQRVLVLVTYSPPSTGLPIAAACLGQMCPTAPPKEPSKGLLGFLLVLLAETSAWLIGLSIFIGLIIILLICLCSPRNRGGAYPPGVASSPSPASQPQGGTPPAYGTPGITSPGSVYNQSYNPSPRHHFRHTTLETTRRSFVSDDDKYRSGGSVALGRVSPGRSPNGLFSVTQWGWSVHSLSRISQSEMPNQGKHTSPMDHSVFVPMPGIHCTYSPNQIPSEWMCVETVCVVGSYFATFFTWRKLCQVDSLFSRVLCVFQHFLCSLCVRNRVRCDNVKGCVYIVPAFYIKLHMIQYIWTERGPFLCDFSVVEFL